MSEGQCKSCGGALSYVDGDGVEEETWHCETCETYWTVGINVVRNFDEMEMDSISREEKSLEARFEADSVLAED